MTPFSVAIFAAILVAVSMLWLFLFRRLFYRSRLEQIRETRERLAEVEAKPDPEPKGRGPWMRAQHIFARRRRIYQIPVETMIKDLGIEENADVARVATEALKRLKVLKVIPESAILLMAEFPLEQWTLRLCVEDKSFEKVGEGALPLTYQVYRRDDGTLSA